MFSFFALVGLFVAVSADAYGGGVPTPITTTSVTTQPRHFLRPDPFQSFPQQSFQQQSFPQQFQQDFQPRTFVRQGFVPQSNPTQMISFQRQAQPVQYPFENYQRPQPITNLGYGASSYGLPPQPVPTSFVVQEQPITVSGGFPQALPQTLPQSFQQGSLSPSVLSSINEPTMSVSGNQISQSGSTGSAYGPPPAAHRNYPTPSPHLLHINDVSAQSEEIDSETPKAINEHGFRRWRLAHRKIRA
ncbi:unnamed protein product, partial [Mesorhabditis belari]|uniref:Uncharacterized protein n=1 Tax=Mesorhabditis belari TaxID=2138241 RepID=A0AAF3FMW5_9BILA